MDKTESVALNERRLSLLESIAVAADEIKRIDEQIIDNMRRDSYESRSSI